MDRDTVIEVTGLGKRYTIGHRGEVGGTLRDTLVRNVASLARKTGDMLHGRPLIAGDELEEFWALRDVNFAVKRGDVLGIIGRNGAGKSTLLKLLSRITEPSEGRIEIRGRVASLLEVGTGFHPELSGRENIFLNGAILGMTRAEIRRKFDEIVAFAGVEKFLDTPVKRFSSGMYVRLAFAVAAHLEPEILIVDEVLAVGDAEFQQKCLGKMKDVAGEGRTVLFVSHNLAAVRQLCGRGVLLSAGKVEFVGTCEAVIDFYLDSSTNLSAKFERDLEFSSPRPYIASVNVAQPEWNDDERCLELPVSLRILSPVQQAICIDLRVKDQTGTPIGFASSGMFGVKQDLRLEQGATAVAARLDVTGLAVGHYSLSVDLAIPWVEYDDRLEDVVRFDILPQHWHMSRDPLKLEYHLGAMFLKSSISVTPPA